MRFHILAISSSLLVAAPAMAADVEGSTTGVFVNPSPSNTTYTGVGTSSFTYGSGGRPNRLTFAGTSFASALESPFKIGSLTYFNGETSSGSSASAVDLALTLAFAVPTLGNVANTFTFSLIQTNNGGNQNASADYVYFPNTFSSSEFVINDTTYRVQLTGFANVQGDGFLTSDSTRLHVRENRTASADLFAVVTSRSAVPEPATWALMIAGFGATGFAMRRRGMGTAAIA